MCLTEKQAMSYRLEKEADTLMIDVLRILAETADMRCLVHGRLRMLDKPLLKKCVDLIMIYDNIPNLNQLSRKLNIGSSTLNKLINESDETTANRTSVDKLVAFMYQLADDYEKKIKKPQ